jgi:hypothetical protein
MSAIITTGDDVTIPVTLKKNGTVFNIGLNAQVKVAIIAADRSKKLTNDILCSPDSPGADWANSLLMVEIPSSETVDMTVPSKGSVLLEIQVDDGGKLTWTVPLKVMKGIID